jgi:hypothetical protein
MAQSQTVWIHAGSQLFSFEAPDRLLETVWIAHPGWGYLKCRDLWAQAELTQQEIQERGFVRRARVVEGGAMNCPGCGMYIHGIPGYLVRKHVDQCLGNEENPAKMEEQVITQQRIKAYEKKIVDEIIRLKKEQEYQERKERFDKIRQDAMSKQAAKDRKKAMKQRTREELRKR